MTSIQLTRNISCSHETSRPPILEGHRRLVCRPAPHHHPPGWLQSKGTNESCTEFHVRQTEVYSKRNIIFRCFRFPSHSLQKRPNGWHSWNLYLVRSKWASNAVPRLCCSQQHISCRPILRDYSSLLFWQNAPGLLGRDGRNIDFLTFPSDDGFHAPSGFFSTTGLLMVQKECQKTHESLSKYKGRLGEVAENLAQPRITT